MSQLSLKTNKHLDSAQSRLRLHAAGHSITGTRHRVNQDRFLVDNPRGLYMVADGMGGCRAGERASHLAVNLLANHPALLGRESDSSDTIRQAISDAFVDVNHEIVAMGNADAQLYGMGTTAVLAWVIHNHIYIASLGDSRAYLLRDGDLHQYTDDHNMAQMLVNLGVISRQDASDHHWRHMLWKYLGVKKLNEGPDVNVVRIEPGDRVLLVTDGVTETLSKRDMLMILKMHPSANDAAEALTRSAVARGTRDDATSVVLNIV